jgi:DDE domain
MLLRAVHDAHIFKRNKIPPETKVLACLLYMAGLSYRAMTLQTGIIPACYRSVHYWVQQLKGIGSRVQVKERRFVAIDETKQKINGRQLFVWSAIDVETKELLAMWASYQRSSFAALVFVKTVLGTCAKARGPGRWRTMVSLGAGEAQVEVASHHVRREELDREVLPNLQGEDEEILQQHQCEDEQDRVPVHVPQPIRAVV